MIVTGHLSSLNQYNIIMAAINLIKLEIHLLVGHFNHFKLMQTIGLKVNPKEHFNKVSHFLVNLLYVKHPWH